ncbi:hypothetical protein DNH61_02775 [Paenibacillus sambharensis]|uniref:Uncharacterized protein n=1 Tax=Paenibacillus sambharensis TaxID=1803190 RepID=A0A2W1LR22_9BACL|nr:hypothetical protein [Paenibacillus sambharensis]PZD97295.1 hypothetical protein DNH61_02775 [Paenibacillus sambharensis]
MLKLIIMVGSKSRMVSALPFTAMLLIVLIAAGCSGENSRETERFNDRSLKFKLLDSRQNDALASYTLQVKNEGLFTVRHLRMYIDYPILTETGSMYNPYKLEGDAEGTGPYHLEPGDEITYRFITPVYEVFGEKGLDYDNPSIELKGVVLEGDSEIPFTITGGMALLTQTE